LKKPIIETEGGREAGIGGVPQGVCPEFKSQYCEREGERERERVYQERHTCNSLFSCCHRPCRQNTLTSSSREKFRTLFLSSRQFVVGRWLYQCEVVSPVS
jgi:hypothetical protein